ncbi:MAG TPA: FixH family protein [Pseudolabrys sp.]|nr:FixH family protein [Pseudolabrys sp.]
MNLFRRKKSGELTGWMVLLWLVGFFGVVFVVNGIMAKAAISTFGGVETQSSYKAGQMFEQEVAKAERQDAQHWQIDGKLARDRAGEAVLDIVAHDEKGAPLTGLKAVARLAHPADERLDRVFELARIGSGEFHGQIDAKPGQWELLIDLYRGEHRVFRSRNRVTLN